MAQLLVNAKADVDSQCNRKHTPLVAAFRKGHVKIVKYMVKQALQFPSDQECMRFITTIVADKVCARISMLLTVSLVGQVAKLEFCRKN